MTIPDLPSLPRVARLASAEKLEGAFGVELLSGFLGRFGNRADVPEDGVEEVATWSHEISFARQ